MKVIIDRIEGDFAIVELKDKDFANLPVKLLPDGAKEGSVIEISLCESETAQRQEKISGLMDKLFK